MSPDYEPLSPAMSSPGPSISERGGHNSPARSLVSEPGLTNIVQQVDQPIPSTSSAVQSCAAPRTSANNQPASLPTIKLEPIEPQQKQPQQPIPRSIVLASATNKPGIPTPKSAHTFPKTTSAIAATPKPKTLVFTGGPPNITTTNTKPRYVIEKTVGGSTFNIVSDSSNANAAMGVANVAAGQQAQKRAAKSTTMQTQQPPKKEMKIYRMSAASPMQCQPTIQTTNVAGGKHVAAAPNATKPAGGAYVINKNAAGQFGGVRKLVRVQSNGIVGGGTTSNGVTLANASRSILLPVSFQDVKDFRTIKIINASNFNNKSANIKLAAANLLQQSKQGLVQKNVLFSKEQLIGKLSSDSVRNGPLRCVFDCNSNAHRRFAVRSLHVRCRELRFRRRTPNDHRRSHDRQQQSDHQVEQHDALVGGQHADHPSQRDHQSYVRA